MLTLSFNRVWMVTVVQRQAAKLSPNKGWPMFAKFEVKSRATDPYA